MPIPIHIKIISNVGCTIALANGVVIVKGGDVDGGHCIIAASFPMATGEAEDECAEHDSEAQDYVDVEGGRGVADRRWRFVGGRYIFRTVTVHPISNRQFRDFPLTLTEMTTGLGDPIAMLAHFVTVLVARTK